MMTNAQELQHTLPRPGETDKDWLIRMLEFHRDSHKWFIDHPNAGVADSEYVGDCEFHEMVWQRYERMIEIAKRATL